jgi:hypothetical protein
MKRCMAILAVVFMRGPGTLEASLDRDAASTGIISLRATAFRHLAALYFRARPAAAGGTVVRCLVVISLLVGFSYQPAFAQDGASLTKSAVPTKAQSASAPEQKQPGSPVVRPPQVPPAVTQSPWELYQSGLNSLSYLMNLQSRARDLEARVRDLQSRGRNGAAYLSNRNRGGLIEIPTDISTGRLIEIPTDISAVNLVPLVGGGQNVPSSPTAGGSPGDVTPPPQHK